MKTLYILCGLGFSGKSTLAKRVAEAKHAVLVSQDEIYFEKEKELDPHLTDAEEWDIIRGIAFERITNAILDGKSVVYDSTNTRREHRDAVRDIALQNGAHAVVLYLDTPGPALVERQMKNLETNERHDVEQKYLDQAREEMEVPLADENVVVFRPEDNIDEWLENLQ